MTRTIMVISIAAGLLAGCATVGDSVTVGSQASGSPYFYLSRPGVYKLATGLQLMGRVCRRSRATQLSPPRVRLEHVSATGDVVEISHASVGAIYRNADQPCSDYSARVGWQIADGETIRACFDHGRACPTDPAVKAVVAVPVTPALPTITAPPR